MSDGAFALDYGAVSDARRERGRDIPVSRSLSSSSLSDVSWTFVTVVVVISQVAWRLEGGLGGRQMEDGTRFQHDRSNFQDLGDHLPPTLPSFAWLSRGQFFLGALFSPRHLVLTLSVCYPSARLHGSAHSSSRQRWTRACLGLEALSVCSCQPNLRLSWQWRNVASPKGQKYKRRWKHIPGTCYVCFGREGASVQIVAIHTTTYRSIQVSFVLPGPEQPLVDGVEEYFRKGDFSRPWRVHQHRSPPVSRDSRIWPFAARRPYGRLEGVLKSLHGPSQHPNCSVPCFCCS